MINIFLLHCYRLRNFHQSCSSVRNCGRWTWEITACSPCPLASGNWPTWPSWSWEETVWRASPSSSGSAVYWNAAASSSRRTSSTLCPQKSKSSSGEQKKRQLEATWHAGKEALSPGWREQYPANTGQPRLGRWVKECWGHGVLQDPKQQLFIVYSIK